MSGAESLSPASHDLVLARHGRSFHFASRFLGREHASRAARLYSFCRHVDDLADGARDSRVRIRRLALIDDDLAVGRRRDPIVADLLDLADTTGLNVAWVRELVAGVRGDVGRVEIADVVELLRYGYRVAGTVGLMMCAVLDARDPRAQAHAIDLGIAMQLTNIARDVMDDARSHRRYLPGVWLDGMAPENIAACPRRVRGPVRAAVMRLLRLAEDYYASGEAGLRYLTARPRRTIKIAARLYRAIGQELERQDFEPWRRRAVVSTGRKLLIASRALLEVEIAAPPRRWTAHGSSLHSALIGLPGANPPRSMRGPAR